MAWPRGIYFNVYIKGASMVLKLSKIKIFNDAKIFEKLKGIKDLSPVQKWALTKFVKKVDEELNDLEVVRIDQIKRLGVALDPEDTGKLTVPDDKMSEFYELIQTVLNKDIEFPDFKLKPEEVGDFSIQELLIMEDLIDG